MCRHDAMAAAMPTGRLTLADQQDRTGCSGGRMKMHHWLVVYSGWMSQTKSLLQSQWGFQSIKTIYDRVTEQRWLSSPTFLNGWNILRQNNNPHRDDNRSLQPPLSPVSAVCGDILHTVTHSPMILIVVAEDWLTVAGWRKIWRNRCPIFFFHPKNVRGAKCRRLNKEVGKCGKFWLVLVRLQVLILLLCVIQAACECWVTLTNSISLILRPTQNASHALIAQSRWETQSFDDTRDVAPSAEKKKSKNEPSRSIPRELNVLWIISQQDTDAVIKIIMRCSVNAGFCRPRRDGCLRKAKQPALRHHKWMEWCYCWQKLYKKKKKKKSYTNKSGIICDSYNRT